MKRVTDKQYWMDDHLKKNLDTLIYNLGDDFDFVILISGDGMTRVGKSMLAQQVGYYISWSLNKPFNTNNIVFGGDELVKKAYELPKQSIIINDESRADLSSKKVMETHSKDLMDFFNECGKLNHLMILVATDFFDFNTDIAVTRSEALINVHRKSEKVRTKDRTGEEIDVIKFKRGYGNIYGRDKKRKLYFLGKKNYRDYNASPRDTYFEFRKFWCLNEEEYNIKKDIYLKRDRANKQNKGNGKIILALKKHPKTKDLTDEEIAEIFNVSRMTIHRHKKKAVTSLVMPD